MYFFFNDTATTEIYTLSLHDALPILEAHPQVVVGLEGLHALDVGDGGAGYETSTVAGGEGVAVLVEALRAQDRKSTRLNSSHANISYAVLCLKKKIQTHSCSKS